MQQAAASFEHVMETYYEQELESMYFTAVAQKLFSSIDSFSYLSIVLFIFAAEVMTCCELTEDLVKFCNAFIGHIRGGLALVNVLASMLFAGVSGSASADTSGLGRVEIDMMTKAGYDRTYSTTMARADRQAAAEVYQLSQLLSSLTQIKKDMDEANRKINFIRENMKKRKE